MIVYNVCIYGKIELLCFIVFGREEVPLPQEAEVPAAFPKQIDKRNERGTI